MSGKSVTEVACGRGDVGQAAGGVVTERVGPKSRWLSEDHFGSEPFHVSVCNRVFGQQLVAGSVSIYCARHVCHAIERIVFERNVGTAWVIDEGEVAECVVRVVSVAFCGAPAVGEAAVGIVIVFEDYGPGLIEFVGGAAIFVIVPFIGLVFAVHEGEEVTGRVVIITDGLVFGIGLGDFAAGFVIGVEIAVTDLIGIGNHPTSGVAEFFDTAVGVAASEQAAKVVVSIGHGDAAGIRDVLWAAFEVIGRGLLRGGSYLCRKANVTKSRPGTDPVSTLFFSSRDASQINYQNENWRYLRCREVLDVIQCVETTTSGKGITVFTVHWIAMPICVCRLDARNLPEVNITA